MIDTSREVAFVTVLEPNGVLEPQVLLLAESLRRFGGRLAGSPLICVSPRTHAGLKRSTRDQFDALGITHVDKNFRHRHAWYQFTPKLLAMTAAQAMSDATHLVWVDADMLILDEPEELLGADGADFAACPSGRDIATSGPADRYYLYWREVCALFNLEVKDLPWVVTHHEGGAGPLLHERRPLPNAAGVALDRAPPAKLREAHGLGAFHVNRHHLGKRDARVVVGPDHLAIDLARVAAVVQLLGERHSREGQSRGIGVARVLHYHLSLSPANRASLLSYFRSHRPDQLAWLEEKGALTASAATLSQRVIRRALRFHRDRKLQQFLGASRTIDTSPRPDAALAPA